MSSSKLPVLPAPHAELGAYIVEHGDTPLTELVAPYRKYEAQLRQIYAQEPENPILKDPHLNVLPLFSDGTADFKVRARDLDAETEAEKERYIMSLPDEQRRPNGSPATVQSFKEFQRNFNVFSESSLVELDWGNVVAAGSSVVNTLLPVPKKFNKTKKGLREFYHEKFCPASDVDLFLYDLTEEQAVEKIKDIETRVRDALLTETTTVRTKHAVTICSQYPTRHIQIVLRIYKSVSEILTGFDIDSSGAAYDGKQVYCTPRALQSYITQINHVDLSRRSPSYENRLSKYSHRGFEVYWTELDRSRIDPTIFERSFQRTLGLARLLVLERLPTSTARDKYTDKRREERGRPAINRYNRYFRTLHGNIKDAYEDEVAEWVNEEEVSNYHTFTVPYGAKFHAKKIEKLCYTRDLLLNAEWNQPDDREVYLHRHPAFFGRFDDVKQDCCGYCPTPETDEEKDVAEEEEKIYVSGTISFIKDDPGRQQIGSFNPLTDDDWTEMAYVGNTARLCQAIVDGDEEHVQDWLAQDGADPNARDHTGRSPLHLAVTSSTVPIVRLLVDAGARLVARLADGRTALHLAAERGDVEIVKILLERSLKNEAEEEEKADQRRKVKAAARSAGKPAKAAKEADTDDSDADSDVDMVDDDEGSDDEARSMASGSFVEVKRAKKQEEEETDIVPDEAEDEPDFYDINVVSWDTPCSALHFAIVSGHEEVVKVLCQEYGADVLLPVKFLGAERKPHAALLTLVLALALPVEQAKSMAKTLMSLGATAAQADLNEFTAFHRYVENNVESLLDTLWEVDQTGSNTAVKHISFTGYQNTITPLQTAIEKGNLSMVLKLLHGGALVNIDFETWLKAAKQSASVSLSNYESNQEKFKKGTEPPLIQALLSMNPSIALELLKLGADPNVITLQSQENLHYTWQTNYKAEAAIDVVRGQLKSLREYTDDNIEAKKKPEMAEGAEAYLAKFENGSYQHAVISRDIKHRVRTDCRAIVKWEEEEEKRAEMQEAIAAKRAAINELIVVLEEIEKALVEKDAKTFNELYPDAKNDRDPYRQQNQHNNSKKEPAKSNEYKYNFSFFGTQDVTEARKAAYIELFEAAWNGDLDKIKTLTLTSWDAEKEEPPLKICVRDDIHNTPFSIAFFRGHLDVAKAVLEIARAQYEPEVPDKVRYRMGNKEPGQDYDSEAEDEDDEVDEDGDVKIYKEKVNDKFTIDNIGQVSLKVHSRTKPQEFAQWGPMEIQGTKFLDNSSSIWTIMIHNNDMNGLRFLLDLMEHYSSQKLDPLEDVTHFFSFTDAVFKNAIREGRTEILAEMIKRTGAGLPLEDFIKSSGIEIKEVPKTYQGLTVYGKKRKDWATAGREVINKDASGSQDTPLLYAANVGCIESVEWFLSDAPLRHYVEFGKSKAAREDARLKHLNQSPGGFDKAVAKWLTSDSDLVIHAAILSGPSQKSDELVSYLIKSCPEAINARRTSPLFLATKVGRLEVIKLLLDAGADPSVKNESWCNLLHAALHFHPEAERLKSFLDVLGPKVYEPMFKERIFLTESGRTPLHQWLDPSYYTSSYTSDKGKTEERMSVLQLILQAGGGHELELLDGSGDTPLHTLIRGNGDINLIRALLEFKPSILYRENAVGRTPADIARDRVIAAKVAAPNSYRYRPWGHHNNSRASKTIHSALSEWLEKPETASASAGGRSSPEQVFDLCREFLERNPSAKRRLVSLNEANDVARRLGEEQKPAAAWEATAPESDAEDEAQKPAEEEEVDYDMDGNPQPKQDTQVTGGAFMMWRVRDPISQGWHTQEKKVAKKWPRCERCGAHHERAVVDA